MSLIIGLSGKAGTGKDAVAKILVKEYNFVRVAFADPLKRICKEIFGFSDEQLWGPSEKRNEPDKRYPRTHTIPYNLPNDKRQSYICLCCGWDAGTQILDGRPSPKCYLTPRYALQKIGTEYGRDCYQNVWVDYTLRIVKELFIDRPDGLANYYDPVRGLYQERKSWCMGEHSRIITNFPVGIVISDVRFKNEFERLSQEGGVVARIVRPDAGLKGSAGEHLSETEINEISIESYHHTIDNDQSLDDLKKKISEWISSDKVFTHIRQGIA